jgi:hypothetical protein
MGDVYMQADEVIIWLGEEKLILPWRTRLYTAI